MALKLVKIEPKNEEEYNKFIADEKDSSWLSENYDEIKNNYKGKYIAVVNAELFVGETAEEAEKQAKMKYPDRDPLIDYIPYKRRVLVL